MTQKHLHEKMELREWRRLFNPQKLNEETSHNGSIAQKAKALTERNNKKEPMFSLA
ncbi:Uncharacterised protein [Plesiomonas shigelloides]|uniref:hypothetical protein n=1 Tax=Plesiomonas shigelloides TaxID=703 RepID=UPI0007F17B0F|nr:hypothetical protein [Plesiomonas shigelloides]SBT61269.1 Uncharacterised protein [Plesiomonas shigelloides]